MEDNSRRQLLKLLAGSGAATASALIPPKWEKPTVSAESIAAHAQSSVENYLAIAPFELHATPSVTLALAQHRRSKEGGRVKTTGGSCSFGNAQYVFGNVTYSTHPGYMHNLTRVYLYVANAGLVCNGTTILQLHGVINSTISGSAMYGHVGNLTIPYACSPRNGCGLANFTYSCNFVSNGLWSNLVTGNCTYSKAC